MEHDEKRQDAVRELDVHRRWQDVRIAAAERESLASHRRTWELRREAAHHAGQHVHVDPPEPPRFTPPEPPVMDNSTLTAANIAARRAAEARRRAGRIASLYYTQTPTPILP